MRLLSSGRRESRVLVALLLQRLLRSPARADSSQLYPAEDCLVIVDVRLTLHDAVDVRLSHELVLE